MKRITILSAATGLAIIASMALSPASQAHQAQAPGHMGPGYGMGSGYGMGPGMMGPGYGTGYGYGCGMAADPRFHMGQGMMGPGMMDPGMMGPGMMGPGMMGPGMMGPGMMGQGMMGQGMGPGMMGPGMGQGMGQGMGPGMGQGGMAPGYGAGPGYWQNPAMPRELTTADVERMLTNHLEWQGNPNIKLGKVEDKDENTIVAEIVTNDGALVDRLEVDRRTGQVRRPN
jgi:hypothetical protein